MPADPRRVKDLFGAAVALADPAAREELLDRECRDEPELRQRLGELLRAHAHPESALERPLAVADPVSTNRTADLQPAPGAVGAVIAGRYKLLEMIGEGGMGEVWVADQQEPIKRRVALKMIKPGMDSRTILGRFEAERQALALMDHPNIAKVLDAGTTDDGRPFFVMELVKGTPITEFCDARKLSPRDRLALFVPVCLAIQHAHMKGVIHRDIKPSNVLVALHDERPVPVVIDFGVAKAVGQQLTEKTIYTGFGGLVGTPAYMAPEQATFNQLDIDTRADVYALGVMLYELLAGSPPFEPERLKRAALDEMLRLVREEEPQRPSQRLSTSQSKATIAATRQSDPTKLANLMRGELDWIVMKSLEKDRTRRYETAAGLAKDVERYLAGDAVEACPPTLGYRLRKAYRKNRGAALTAVAVLLGALLAVAGQTWNVLRARTAEADAVAARIAEAEQRDETAKQRDETAKQRDAAIEAGKEADRKRAETNDALKKLRQAQERQQADQYVWDMQILPLAFDANNFAEVNRLLDRHAPQPGQPDRRGFEWYYWNRQLNTDLRTDRLPDIGTARGHWATSPDGSRVALFTTPRPEDAQPNDSPVLTVWDVAARKVVLTHRMPIKKPVNQTYMGSNPVRPLFSKDGTRVVVEWGVLTSQPPAVHQLRQILEVPTGKVLLTLEGERGGMRFAQRGELEGAFSPDGRRFAAVCPIPGKMGQPNRPAREVRVWEVDGGKEVCPPLDVEALADSPFSPDGTLLVTRKTVGTGSRVSVWDVDKNQERVGWDVLGRSVSALTVSPDGNRVAAVTAGHAPVAGLGGRAAAKGDNPPAEPERGTIWSVETGKELHTLSFSTLTGPRYTPRVFFSPDGTRLAIERFGALAGSGRPVSDLAIWDAVSGKVLTPPATQDADGPTLRGARGVTFSPDGKQLLSADGNVLRTWEVDTGRPVLALRGHVGPIGPGGFSPDGKRLWSLEDNGLLKEWDARPAGGVAIRFANTRTDAPASTGFAVSPDGSRVASILDIGSNQKAFATASAVRIWDAAGKSVEILTPAPREPAPKSQFRSSGPFNGLALSRDGKRAVLTRADERPDFGKNETVAPPDLTVWDVESKKVLLHQQLEGRQPPFVAISPNGRTVAVAVLPRPRAGEVTVRMFDVDGGRERTPLVVETTGIFGISFSPDGRRLAGLCMKYTASIGKASTTLVVWDVESGSQSCTLEAETDGPVSVSTLTARLAWAPDGSRFAFAHGRPGASVLAVYDAATGKKLLTLDQPLAAEPGSYNYPHLAYSPDGKRIAAFLVPWVLDGTPALKVWDADSGKELLAIRSTMRGHVSVPKSLTFTADGHHLLFTELVNDAPRPGTDAPTSPVRSLLLTTWDATPRSEVKP